MNLTDRQFKGHRFEIWLERQFIVSQYKTEVDRNVVFWKRRYSQRQVDICYNSRLNGSNKLVLVEAKYSSNGLIRYHFRRRRIRKKDQMLPSIDNLVDEVLERQLYVGGFRSYLVTNTDFEGEVYDNAKKRRIVVINGDGLVRNFGYSIEELESIDPLEYRLKALRYRLN